jgi:hypothetical protein
VVWRKVLLPSCTRSIALRSGSIQAATTVLATMLLGTACSEPAVEAMDEQANVVVEPPGPEIAVKPEAGVWGRFRTHQFDDGLDAEQRERIARLEALGYASGVEPPPAASRVTRHDPAQAFAGSNLYSSAHRPEAILMDMGGTVLHRWHLPFETVWPDYPGKRGKRFETFWRRVRLFPNGDLLAIFEGLGILRIDKHSEIIWASTVRAHHDLDIAPDGTLYVLTREAHVVPRVNEQEPILEDFISTLDEHGRETDRISILEAMERSPFRKAWDKSGRRSGDLFHTNTLVWLDGSLADRVPEFRRGNFLISMNWLNTIAVLDPEQRKIVWAQTGPFFTQHDPKILPNGTLLLFNNRVSPERSGVWALDPLTREITWRYQGRKDEPFYSGTCGAAERLPNGNTLVTESDAGRAFELNPKKQIVWEFYNPERAGEQGEFIATIMEMIRIPADFPLDWADGANDG